MITITNIEEEDIDIELRTPTQKIRLMLKKTLDFLVRVGINWFQWLRHINLGN